MEVRTRYANPEASVTLTNHGSYIPPVWEYTGKDVMLYPGGRTNGQSSFRCEDCGCNVFKEVKFTVYECNGCGARYKGFR